MIPAIQEQKRLILNTDLLGSQLIPAAVSSGQRCQSATEYYYETGSFLNFTGFPPQPDDALARQRRDLTTLRKIVS